MQKYFEMKLLICILCSLAAAHLSLSCTTDDDILIDIIFVVDGSASIGRDHFDVVKAWLTNATTMMFNTFGRRAQFEVIEYSNKEAAIFGIPIAKSTKFEIPFRLGECDSIRCMTSRISHMEYLNGHTYTYYALRRVLEVEFPLSIHYPNSKKAIILFTDGEATDGVYLPRAYRKTVEENITNFAIGVGDFLEQELREFANGGGSNDRVFTRTDFESLSSVITELQTDLEREGFFCDECQSGSHTCSVHAACIDTVDSYQCECGEGYYGNGVICVEIDYCANNPCADFKHSRCIAEDNKPLCICVEGFRVEKDSCVDINECEPGDNVCPLENSVCRNHEGSYECPCADGYELNEGECTKTFPLSDVIAVISFTLATLIIVALIIFVAVKRRRRSFSPRAASSDSEDSPEQVELYGNER